MRILRAASPKTWARYLDGAREEVDGSLARAWSRALDAGASWLHAERSSQDPFLGAQTTRERQQRAEPVWRHVEPVLSTLTSQLERSGFLGVWADPEGVILHQRGGGEFLTMSQRLELVEGAAWAEPARGTNAIGTALIEQEDVVVLGAAHLQQPNHALVCYGALVRDPSHEIVGVLDVTSRHEAHHEMALAAVMAARHTIELGLKSAAYTQAISGGLMGLLAMLERCPAPALLIERDGTCRASNARARAALAHQGQAPLTWAQLERLRDAPAQALTLRCPAGRAQDWRVIPEWIGQPPLAALIFLEPLGAAAPTLMSRSPATSSYDELTPAQRLAFAPALGHDPALRQAQRLTARLARSALPVLFLAETGTGKELFARALHQLSPRADKPWMALNCAALSQTLLEAELFGYAPGAFTGARPQGQDGKLAAAHGGTLFLDEIAELPLSAQALLLRFLDHGVYFRVGESRERHADVRLVAATCRDLEAMVAQGLLRADLYYRLKGARVALPALRQRHDLEALVSGLLDQLHAQLDLPGPCPAMSLDALDLMRRYSWPGNVRELKHALQVALLMADDAQAIGPEHLPEDLRQHETPQDAQGADVQDVGASPDEPLIKLAHLEGQTLRAAIERAKGNMSEAARQLGVARSTLYRMMERHGLR